MSAAPNSSVPNQVSKRQRDDSSLSTPYIQELPGSTCPTVPQCHSFTFSPANAYQHLHPSHHPPFFPFLTRHPNTISIPLKQPTTIPLQRRIQPVKRRQADARRIRHILTILPALLFHPCIALAADARLRLLGWRCAARTRRIWRRS